MIVEVKIDYEGNTYGVGLKIDKKTDTDKKKVLDSWWSTVRHQILATLEVKGYGDIPKFGEVKK